MKKVNRDLNKKLIVITSIVVFSFMLAVYTNLTESLGSLGLDTRFLGKLYVYFTNHEDPRVSTASLEPVAAIVWDFRGLDTLYETTVFAMAIIAIYSLFRIDRLEENESLNSSFTIIPRLVTKILLPINIAIASTIAFHGSISPGGGFQAGSILAVIGVLFVVIFSYYALNTESINPHRALLFMSSGLIAIVLVSLIPLAFDVFFDNAYLMQNQPKLDSAFGYPKTIGGFVFGGSIGLFNIFEFIAVSFGFLTAFALLSIPEYVFKEKLGGEESLEQ
jgi:multicomponent Na+:H+ antiporter subunit B